MSDRNRKIVDGIRNSALIQNPVLFEAIGIAPIAAIAVSLKTAIILAVASCLELVIIELFTCLALKKVKSYFRMPVYAALGMLINLPVFMFFAKFTPNEALNVGIFLPLLAVNSLIALHCERFAVKNKMKDTFVDAISAAAGYAFVLLLVGTAREILGSGTIYSIDLHLPVQLSGLLMPFGGLLLVGFLAAAVKALIAKRYPEEDPENAFRMQEISESHVGSFRTLAQSDFNPYGDTEDEDAPRVKREKAKKEKPVKEKRGKKKPKQEKIKKEKPKKSGKVSKKKKPDLEAAEMPQSVPTAAPVAEAEERPVRRARQEDDDYLLEFDEMLSELDSYKKKQHEKAEETEKAAQAAKAAEKAEKEAETESAKEAEAAQTAAAEAAAQEASAGEPAPTAEKPKKPKAKSKAKAETEPKKKTTSKAKSDAAPKKKAAKSETTTRKPKKTAADSSAEAAEPKKPVKKKAETTKKSPSKAKTPAKKQEGGDEK